MIGKTSKEKKRLCRGRRRRKLKRNAQERENEVRESEKNVEGQKANWELEHEEAK